MPVRRALDQRPNLGESYSLEKDLAGDLDDLTKALTDQETARRLAEL